MTTAVSVRLSSSGAASDHSLPSRRTKPYHGPKLAMEASLDDIDRAVSGDVTAMGRLVKLLRPIIQAAVGKLLFRLGSPQGWDPRQECHDLVQEVFVALLAKNGKILRTWDPERGTLDRFVRLIARRHVIGVLRVKGRNPWNKESLAPSSLDEHVGELAFDGRADARARLAKLYERLEQRLDERGMTLFHMLYVEQLPIDDVCWSTGMTHDAVYAWRSRLKKILVQLKTEMDK